MIIGNSTAGGLERGWMRPASCKGPMHGARATVRLIWYSTSRKSHSEEETVFVIYKHLPATSYRAGILRILFWG